MRYKKERNTSTSRGKLRLYHEKKVSDGLGVFGYVKGYRANLSDILVHISGPAGTVTAGIWLVRDPYLIVSAG